MVKVNRSSVPRQAKSVSTGYLCQRVLQAVSKNPTAFPPIKDIVTLIKSLTGSERAVLNQLLYYKNKLGKNWIKRDKLSELTGYTERTMVRATNRLQELGLIHKKIMGWGWANEYALHPMFNDVSWGQYLLDLLPAIKWIALPLGLLTSSMSFTNVTPNLPKIVISKSSSSSLSVTKDARACSKGTDTALFLQKGERGGLDAQQKKDKRMQDSEAAVKAIRTLRLTGKGKAIIASYPAEAVKYADNRIFYSKKQPVNPIGYFKSLCEEYCKINKLTANWERVDSWKKISPFWDDLLEVTENVVWQSAAKNAATLSGAKDYLPGKEWELEQQRKQILKPINKPELQTVRQPVFKPTADQAQRLNLNKDTEMQAAYETVAAKGALNRFSHFLDRKEETVKKIEETVKNTIIAIHGDIELYEERKSMPIDYGLMEEIHSDDFIDTLVL